MQNVSMLFEGGEGREGVVGEEGGKELLEGGEGVCS